MQSIGWTQLLEGNTAVAELASISDVERDKQLWARTKAHRLYAMGELAKAAQLLMELEAA